MKKKLLLERKAALSTDIQTRLAQVEASEQTGSDIDFTAVLTAVDKLSAELETVNEQVEAVERLEEQIRGRAEKLAEKLPPKATGATVHPNKVDQPWSGMGEMLQAVQRADSRGPVDERLAAGLNEGTGAEGGFLVGTDMSNKLLEQAYAVGTIANDTSKIEISSGSNGVKIPAVADKNRTDGNRWGGVRGYWMAEAGLKTPSTPAPFEQIELQLKKLAALIYATDELLQDATAIEGWINKTLPQELSFLLDDAIIRGDGVGKPLGILNSGSLIVQAAEGSQTADTINLPNVVKMYARMPARLKRGAKWYVGSEILPQLQMMTSATTSASEMVYMPPGGVSQAPFGTLFGRPVEEIEYASAIGDVGDIIFANFGEYWVARKGGIQTAVSIHVKFLTDETAFRFVMRVDGRPAWNGVLTPAHGANTQSPFVVLAAR